MERIRSSFRNVINVIKKSGRASTRYIEGLVYSLLSTLRANDQGRFLTYLLTFLNTFEEKAVGDFIKELYEVFPLSEEKFQQLGYLIIMGLMSAKGGE